MSESDKNRMTGNDEIDLVDLFTRLWHSIRRGCRALGRTILYIIAFILRKWLWLTLSLIAGVALAFFMKYSSERIYSSDITLRSNTIENADMISYINKLHIYCREKNYGELSAALGISVDIAFSVKDIGAHWVVDMGNDEIPDYVDFRDKHNTNDTINVRMSDRFVIRVYTGKPGELSVIRDGIITFIEGNSYYREQNELRLRQNKIILARLEYEIDQLDSLQKVKYFEESRHLMPRDGGQMVFLQDYKTQLLHNDIYELYQLQQEVEKDLTIYSDLITVLDDFTPRLRAENGALYYGQITVPSLLFLTVIILLIVDNRKRIRATIMKY